MLMQVFIPLKIQGAEICLMMNHISTAPEEAETGKSQTATR